MPYLSEQALSGLKHYHYKPGGYTLLDTWHTPHWNYIVECLPTWLAPNVITLMGLAAIVLANGIATYYTPEFNATAPIWVYWAMAGAAFFYLHMDCLDGKQARRTGSSSPLGQLFDHGCDTLVVQFVITMLGTSLNLSADWRMTAGTVVICIPFVLAHWEEYHTGSMVYGNGVWGVTEANYAVVLLHATTALVGPAFWVSKPLAGLHPALLSAAPAWVPRRALAAACALTPNGAAVLALAVMGTLMLSEQLCRVFRPNPQQVADRAAHAKERGDHRQLGRGLAAWHLAQLLAQVLLGAALVHAPSSAAGPLRLRLAAYGTAYALQATRLVMAHMAKEPYHVAVWPLAALALQLANAWAPTPIADPALLAAAVAFVILAGYLHYVVSVVREVCASLGIRALTITPKLRSAKAR